MTNLLTSSKTWFTISIAALLLMGGIYIYQVNDLVQNVYLRDQNHQKLAKLQKDIKRSKVMVSKNQSLTQVDKLIKEKGYEKVGQVDYVQVSDTQVASAQ